MFVIFRTLRHYKPIVLIAIMEIAVALILITHAIYQMKQHVARVELSTGIADDHLITLRVTGVNGDTAAPALAHTDLASLADIAGVAGAAQVNAMPLSKMAWNAPIYLHDSDPQPVLRRVPMYVGTQGFLGVLGAQIQTGRDFTADDYVKFDPLSGDRAPAVAIVTTALATRLWPHAPAVGKVLYFGDKKEAIRIVGTVRTVLSPDFHDPEDSGLNLFFPVSFIDGGTYVVRANPDNIDRVRAESTAAIYTNDNNRIVIEAVPYSQSVEAFFRPDRAAIRILITVTCCLVVLTALGIAALSNLWVRQRGRHIGIRRALGARQSDILTYFLTENLLVVAAGAIIGMVGTLIMNHYLIEHFEMHRLPLAYSFCGVLIVALIGQLSVLAPAIRASRIEPHRAIRE